MRKYVVFRLGDREFGIEIGEIIEILKHREAMRLPELDDYISGVIAVRGEVIPVIDMRKRFGVTPAPCKKERLVLVRAATGKVGLYVDEVIEITGFLKENVSTPPVIFKGLKEEYMTGLGKTGERVVILLDMENILSAEERIIVEEAAKT